MSLTPRKRAKILSLYARSRTVRDIARTVGVATSTVSRAVRQAGLARDPKPAGDSAKESAAKVEWRLSLPPSLAAAADRARGHLSRSAYLCAVLARTLGAEDRREGP